MECAAQITGGYFADPGYKDVPNLARVGFPIAEVAADGSAVITKLADAGGLVSERTVKEQLLYEVHDPAAYVTPDVVADFSRVADPRAGTRSGRGERRGRSPGGRTGSRSRSPSMAACSPRPGISYAGPGARQRAELAGRIVEERMVALHGCNAPLRLDLIGVSALHATAIDDPSDARDVRLRAALRAGSREQAELLLWEVELLLCCGPAGGGGYRGQITPSVITHSAYLERDQIRSRLEIIEA